MFGRLKELCSWRGQAMHAYTNNLNHPTPQHHAKMTRPCLERDALDAPCAILPRAMSKRDTQGSSCTIEASRELVLAGKAALSRVYPRGSRHSYALTDLGTFTIHAATPAAKRPCKAHPDEESTCNANVPSGLAGQGTGAFKSLNPSMTRSRIVSSEQRTHFLGS